MDTIKYIRMLAANDEYQNIFIMAKEIGSIKLFDNCNDFTYIQNVFLRYLNFYYSLYSDIALGEVSDIVLEDDIYADAYNMYKNRKTKEQLKNIPQQQRNTEEINSLKSSKWIFKSNPNRTK